MRRFSWHTAVAQVREQLHSDGTVRLPLVFFLVCVAPLAPPPPLSCSMFRHVWRCGESIWYCVHCAIQGQPGCRSHQRVHACVPSNGHPRPSPVHPRYPAVGGAWGAMDGFGLTLPVPCSDMPVSLFFLLRLVRTNSDFHVDAWSTAGVVCSRLCCRGHECCAACRAPWSVHQSRLEEIRVDNEKYLELKAEYEKEKQIRHVPVRVCVGARFADPMEATRAP